MKIVFVADGNNKIGMGHVFRSLNLAKKLSNNGHIVIFLTSEQTSHKIISKTNTCIISTNFNNIKTKQYFKKFSPDLIILDKLKESKKNLLFLKSLGPILAIDYCGKYQQLIKIGINILYPKSGFQKTLFSNFNYAILNKQFLKYRPKKIKEEVKSIIILQGGADTYCYTHKIIDSLNTVDFKFKIHVVIGPSFNCWTKLNKSINKSKKSIILYQNVEKMVSLMKKSDVAITAGGNTLLELAFLGIPSIIVCAEKFEVETASLMQKSGYGKNLGFGGDISNYHISSNLNKIINNFELRKKMNISGPKIIDGKGASRIIDIIEKL